MLRLLFIVAPIFTITDAFAAGDDKVSTSPILVAIITAVFGFLGSWLGASFALQSFKRQRAFDKQLDWYERAAQAIFRLAETIQVADTFQDEKGTPPILLKKQWREVQSAHLQILRVAHDARLYASRNAVAQMNRIAKRVQKVADLTEAFDPPKIKGDEKRKDLLWKIYNLSVFLGDSAPPLLAEGRAHLGIDQKPIFSTSKRRLFRLARYRARKLQAYFEALAHQIEAKKLLTDPSRESDRPTIFARIGVMKALNRNFKRLFNSIRKETHWGKRES